LHRAAQHVRDDHAGRFPEDFGDVVALPGIGRSTAGAILALATDARFPILDGNAKRVLARHFAIDGPIDDAAVVDELWTTAERETPHDDVATYTQAIMDLGATVCTRSRPRCTECPLTVTCRARAHERQAEFPAPKRRRAARPQRRVWMLLATNKTAEVLLLQRPPAGIWGGLWSPPEFPDRDALEAYARTRLARVTYGVRQLDNLDHAFTHFDLRITPIHFRCSGAKASAVSDVETLWFDPKRPQRVGLPAPIKVLLDRLGRSA
jgi:A/G-specific adenine glycosylase